MYFKRAEKVKYYDCDCNNKLKISAAMRYMQQTSSEEHDVIETSNDGLYKHDMVFLLSKTCIKINRMPRSAEQIFVGTAPIATKGVRFIREYLLETQENERLMSAYTTWVLVSPSNRKIYRPTQYPYHMPYQDSIVGGEIGDIIIKKPTVSYSAKSRIEVCYSHIDNNNHLNNCMYADFICDALPYEIMTNNEIDKLALSYHNEAKQGDVINITVYNIPEGGYYLEAKHNRGLCFEGYIMFKASQQT